MSDVLMCRFADVRMCGLGARNFSLDLRVEIFFRMNRSNTMEFVIHNFSAGPSILPKQVFEEASRAVLDYNNTGLSILEIGHRTELFQQIMDEARALVKELMQLDDMHEVLFLH